MDDGSAFIVGVFCASLVALVMFLSVNTSVPYADIHQGIALCKSNGGMRSIAEDKSFERTIYCNDGATYTYQSREWDEAFNKDKTP